MRSIKYLEIKNIYSLVDIKRDENNRCIFPKGKIPYVPCKLIPNEGKEGWYIEYHYLNPLTAKLERGKKRLKREVSNHEGTKAAAKYIEKTIIKEFNKKLESGWTPKGSICDNNDNGSMIIVLLDKWLEEKSEHTRSNTIRVYKSAADRLTEFLNSKGYKNITLQEWSEEASMRLNQYAMHRWTTGTSYNNMRRMWGAFFKWVQKRERYKLDFEPIMDFLDKRKEVYSPLETVPKERDAEIAEWCSLNDPVLMLLISMISGPSFLRVQECLRLRVGDINLEKSTVKLDAWQSKTSAIVKLLSPATCHFLKVMNIENIPKDYFLFNKDSSRYGKLLLGRAPQNRITSKEEKTKLATSRGITVRQIDLELSKQGYLDTRTVDKNWHLLRKKLELSKGITLYSYRHRSISNLYSSGFSRDQITQLTGHLSEAFWHYVSSEAKSDAAKMVAEKCENIFFAKI